jgi:DNA-binding CsgD family transcriptional regulator
VTGALLGRDREVQDVLGWVDEARAGSPRLVLVAGDAGIGKTSLVEAVVAAAADRGLTVAVGRSSELDGAPPFRPWAHVLRALGTEELLAPMAGPDVDVDRFAWFDAVARTLARKAADQGGLLVVLEDVHRADDPSVHLLVHVAETITGGPLCLLVTARSRVIERTPSFRTAATAFMGLPGCRRVDLAGLGLEDVGALLGPGTAEGLVAQALAVTGGNPLFLRELARHWQVGGDHHRTPTSVVDCVRSRIEERTPECVTALQTAAVVGREFPAGLVATALGSSPLACLEALDEADQAGLIEATGEPGWFRFVHVLVRDAVESGLGAANLALAHRRVALAIETYEGTAGDNVAELARHWGAAAALGDRDVAADWCERAAVAADRRLAWEDAARLYDQAAELAGPGGDPLVRHRRLLGSAQAKLHCDDINEAIERCVLAADAVRPLGRPDLLAAAALVPEGRGGPPLSRLRALAEEALAGCAPADHSTRARLLGQLATCAFYLDPSSTDGLSLAASEEADRSGDPLARVAAARARQLALAGPEFAGERLALAAIMGDAGRELGRPAIVQWEPIWRIDSLVELGRLPEAVTELTVLRHRAADVANPIARWHLQRCEGLIAQATGRFDDALAWATQTCELFGRLEDPRGGAAMLAAFETMVAMHTGFHDGLVEQWDGIDLALAPPFLGDLPVLGPLMALLGSGHERRARALYDRLAPVDAWVPPRFLWLQIHALRLWAAVGLGRSADVEVLVAELARHRGTHIAAGGGGLTYAGPVELWMGIGQAMLGRLDLAVTLLREANQTCGRAGAPGFAVHAGTELAKALVRRGAPGDAREARVLAETLLPVATALGMGPWSAALAGLGPRPAGPGGGPLTAREAEVAELVAQGLTNRAIAERLFLSERTAQNHVQHILTKLDLSNRAQIAVWWTGPRGPAPMSTAVE